MYLSGMGVAKQRKAIMTGLKESIVEFNSITSDTTAKDVMDLLVLNQVRAAAVMMMMIFVRVSFCC
jgi:ABC-type sulfate transport system substrate-binding protein